MPPLALKKLSSLLLKMAIILSACVGYEGSIGTYDINLIGSEFVYFELAVGDLVNGRFGDNNLFEYYIGGEAGDTVSFTAKTDDDIDLILKLVDFDGNIMAEVDDGFTSDPETMSYTFEEDALFILRSATSPNLAQGNSFSPLIKQ